LLVQLGLQEEAVALLAELREHGVRLEARSYNVILHTLAEEDNGASLVLRFLRRMVCEYVFVFVCLQVCLCERERERERER